MNKYQKVFGYFTLLLIVFSCGKQQQNGVVRSFEGSEQSIPKKHPKTIVITAAAEKKMNRWKEYENLKEFIQKFHTISPNEALSNARELNQLTLSLRDSLMPAFIKSPAFNARVNLLYNETLRLYDMSSISSIKTEEVNAQVAKVLDAYSSVNSKINTVVKQETLNREIDTATFNRIVSPVIKLIPEKIKKKGKP